MLSEQRYKEVKAVFQKQNATILAEGVEVPPTEIDIRLNADLFEVIGHFTHNKLTTEEMFNAFDFLNDVLQYKKAKYAMPVGKNDKIRVQMRIMEELPETAGKLTMAEKEAFAFCVWYCTCFQIYDEKRKMSLSTLCHFDSIERVESIYAMSKRRYPELFQFVEDNDLSSNDDYGFSLENPVMLTSVRLSYVYLSKLFYNGMPIRYQRQGSRMNSKGVMIDVYLIEGVPERMSKIYINAYAQQPILKAPLGFRLVSL